jgi:hypothetical protein
LAFTCCLTVAHTLVPTSAPTDSVAFTSYLTLTPSSGRTRGIAFPCCVTVAHTLIPTAARNRGIALTRCVTITQTLTPGRTRGIVFSSCLTVARTPTTTPAVADSPKLTAALRRSLTKAIEGTQEKIINGA